MRRTLVFSIVLLLGPWARPQAKIDTIDVGKGVTSILVFPDDIAESMLGDDLFFDVELPPQQGSRYSGRIVKLSYNDASRAKEDLTNYSVVTTDGNMYNFALRLSNRPGLAPHIIAPEMASANIAGRDIRARSGEPYREEGPGELDTVATKVNYYSMEERTVSLDERPEKDSLTLPTKELYDRDPMEYIRKRCYYMQFDKPKVVGVFGRSDRVFIWLKGVYYDRDELYFQFRIDNKEGVDYDINMLKYFICAKKPVSCYAHRPVAEYKVPSRVKGGTENHFVVVFKKFSLGRSRELKIEVAEKHGNRDFSIYVDHHTINNPVRLN